MDKIADNYVDTTNKVSTGVKRYIFDIIAAAILIAIAAASMDIFTGKDVNFKTLFAEWIPFFIATVLLNSDLYEKGVFVGKLTDKYVSIVDAYSLIVANLTGEQIEKLPDYCEQKNDDTLRKIQSNILKKAAVTFEEFDKWHGANNELPPLKILSKKELLEYAKGNKEVVHIINKAKKSKVKGLNSNILLGNSNVSDDTDIGTTEKQLAKTQFLSSAVKYLVSTCILTLIGIKDIADWGWTGLILVVFKSLYTFAKCYLSYFTGYKDITITVSNHISRKTDVLKQYINWAPEKA